ncbi:Unknown protein [Striga hermonthica]|uniref:DUF4219 domain-containing protein n=1 Tax=Striga hermonthica TaxID=68872 RepID=A0A9N7N7Q2_STRHE|nr:Unknown protein [Striga hermonthica]
MSAADHVGKLPVATLSFKFTGNNYGAWEFQFRMFLEGKELWNHIDGTSPPPKEASELSQWESKDAKIISWILASIESHMVNSLRSFRTAKQIVSNEALASLQEVHEVSKRDQLLMKLRLEFESARTGLLNRSPAPTLDVCLGELLREEQRLATLAVMGGVKRNISASNHMTDSPKLLHNLRKSTGTQNIQVANGNNIPIIAIGDIGPSFRDVFVSPELSSNLISVGQLVDDDCEVHFSRNGCFVQDQVSGNVIAKGPKVGRLFPLQFTASQALCLASMSRTPTTRARSGANQQFTCILGNQEAAVDDSTRQMHSEDVGERTHFKIVRPSPLAM